MSSRQLRKLKQQRELEQAKLNLAHNEADEESEDEPIVPTKSKASLFTNLASLGDEDEGNEDKDKGDVVEESYQVQATSSASRNAKKSKKKKKSKKGKEKSEVVENAGDSEDIDAVLRELDLKDPPQPTSKPVTKLPLDADYERLCALLSISSQHLMVANEMRDMYGKDFSIAEATDGNGQGARGGRRRQRQRQEVDIGTALKGKHLPGKGLSSLTLRRNPFIEGKQDWPNSTTGGLAMEIVAEDKDTDTVEFRFTHNVSYQVTQAAFHRLVDEGEPQNLIGLLIENPYHISTLLQNSRYCNNQGDLALSSELLERALFSFGRAATSLFNTKLFEGKARLDFARPENRELWLAGYHYIKSLIQKGTYRTALEWAKLLLSLDPEYDPYAMRFIIHELALRAGQNAWLLQVADSIVADMWGSEDANGNRRAVSHVLPSFALAAMNLKDGTKCRELLSNSMQLLPWLFVRLFGELNLNAPRSIWGIMPRTSAEELLTELYVLHTKDMWGTPEATALLMEIAHTIPKVDFHNIAQPHIESVSLNIVRFIYLEDNQKLMTLAPTNLLHRNTEDSDPYSPDTNVFSYESQETHLQSVTESAVWDDGYSTYDDPVQALLRMIPGLSRATNGDGAGSRAGASESGSGGTNGLPFGDPANRPPGWMSMALAMFSRGPEPVGEQSTAETGEHNGQEDEDTDYDSMPELESDEHNGEM